MTEAVESANKAYIDYLMNMDWFRALVKSDGVIETKYKVTGTKTVDKDKLPEAKGQLKALGYSMTTETV